MKRIVCKKLLTGAVFGLALALTAPFVAADNPLNAADKAIGAAGNAATQAEAAKRAADAAQKQADQSQRTANAPQQKADDAKASAAQAKAEAAKAEEKGNAAQKLAYDLSNRTPPDNDAIKAANKAADDARIKAGQALANAAAAEEAARKAQERANDPKVTEPLQRKADADQADANGKKDAAERARDKAQGAAKDAQDVIDKIPDSYGGSKIKRQGQLDDINKRIAQLALAPAAGGETLATLVGGGKVTAACAGTGETIGHIADLTIQNLTDQPLTALIGPMVLESSSGKNQHYACPKGQFVALNPHQAKTVPVEGVCLVRNKPPVGRGVMGDLLVNEWNPAIPSNPGSHFSGKDAGKLLRIAASKYDAAEKLQKDGALNDLPYHDRQKQKDIVVQWSIWMDPRISEITGVPPAAKEDLKKVVYKQIEEQGPVTPEKKKKLDQGIDIIFEKVELTTAKAKDVEKPDPSQDISLIRGFDPIKAGVIEILENAPAFGPYRETFLPKVRQTKTLEELQDALKPLRDDPRARAAEYKPDKQSVVEEGNLLFDFKPPPWLPPRGFEIVPRREVEGLAYVNEWDIRLRTAINKLWFMGFEAEAKKLRDMFEKGRVRWNDPEVPKDAYGKTDAITGEIFVRTDLWEETWMDPLELLAMTLLHELFHSEHHTGWGYISNLGWAESEVVGVGAHGEDKRFRSREEKLKKDGKTDELEKKVRDSVRSE